MFSLGQGSPGIGVGLPPDGTEGGIVGMIIMFAQWIVHLGRSLRSLLSAMSGLLELTIPLPPQTMSTIASVRSDTNTTEQDGHNA